MAGVVSEASREAVLAWFAEFQRNCVMKDGSVPEWFHGIISRKEAEEMLITKPRGYFLIRVSESRIGYSLSYKAEGRCRHFMIDMLPGNQYVIVGEKTHHRSLHDLVAFYRRTPILPFNDMLTVACGQVSKDKADYAELLFTKRNISAPGAIVQPSMSTQAGSRPQPEVPKDLGPALPSCPPFLNQNLNSCITPATPVHPPRLYPCLDTELTALNLQNMALPPRPLPKPRTKHLGTSPPPPQTPPRAGLLQSPAQNSTGADKKKGLPAAYIERPLPIPQPEDKDNNHKGHADAKSARISLAQCKKIFQKKKHHPEEHTYTDIKEDGLKKGTAFTASEHRENSEDILDEEAENEPLEAGALPIEYLNPPPFAPGY